MQCVCLEDLLVMILGRGPAKIDVVVDVMDFHYLSLCVHCAVRVGTSLLFSGIRVYAVAMGNMISHWP